MRTVKKPPFKGAYIPCLYIFYSSPVMPSTYSLASSSQYASTIPLYSILSQASTANFAGIFL